MIPANQKMFQELKLYNAHETLVLCSGELAKPEIINKTLNVRI